MGNFITRDEYSHLGGNIISGYLPYQFLHKSAIIADGGEVKGNYGLNDFVAIENVSAGKYIVDYTTIPFHLFPEEAFSFLYFSPEGRLQYGISEAGSSIGYAIEFECIQSIGVYVSLYRNGKQEGSLGITFYQGEIDSRGIGFSLKSPPKNGDIFTFRL